MTHITSSFWGPIESNSNIRAWLRAERALIVGVGVGGIRRVRARSEAMRKVSMASGCVVGRG